MKRLFLSLFLLAFLFSGCTTEKPAATAAATETTPQTQAAAFSPISETINGFAMTPDGGSVPVQLTIRVENVLEGDAAYRQLLTQGCEVSAPEDGSEYALISVTVTYDDGEPDTLDFVENYPASLASARVAFHLPPQRIHQRPGYDRFPRKSHLEPDLDEGRHHFGRYPVPTGCRQHPAPLF